MTFYSSVTSRKICNFLRQDLSFFWRTLASCVLGPWPRAFLFLVSRGSALGKLVLSLGLDLGFFCVIGLGLELCVLDSTSA